MYHKYYLPVFDVSHSALYPLDIHVMRKVCHLPNPIRAITRNSAYVTANGAIHAIAHIKRATWCLGL